jgi:hypothetical protein
VTVDLSKVDLPQDTGGAGIDRLEGIANVIGSPFADRLSGSPVANRFEVRDGSGDTVACRDGACGAVHTLSAVRDGAYVLRVRARDTLGALDLSPAERAFSVDTAAPRIARARLTASKRLSDRLSERASVKITLAHGKRSRTLVRDAGRGANRVGLARVVRRLKARSGRVTLVATDGAGNRSKPLRLRLR